ncbi:UNKNOWN [Stylonychia lemnae]|uniref:Transmembrane protein n=1 Tax=Stylonychia lemnae TaxID=5949 RepID=A0A077ZTR7_STYLE|nr:UNKNOWN [Stylonychia lemnae]|eukprot:CDW73292.1 UNKNOWN [Stylonychia lemnae]
MDNNSEDRQSEFYSLNSSTYIPAGSREKQPSQTSRRSKFSNFYNQNSNRNESFKTCNDQDGSDDEFQDAIYSKENQNRLDYQYEEKDEYQQERDRSVTEKEFKRQTYRLDTIEEEDRFIEYPNQKESIKIEKAVAFEKADGKYIIANQSKTPQNIKLTSSSKKSQQLNMMIIAESPDEAKTSFDQLPITRLLNFGTTSMHDFQDADLEIPKNSLLQSDDIQEERHTLSSKIPSSRQRIRVNTVVEKNVALNAFHLKINILINCMMFIVIVLQLSITAWINYPVDYNGMLDDGQINLLNYFSEVGTGLKNEDNSDFKLDLAESAIDDNYCHDQIKRFASNAKLDKLCSFPFFIIGFVIWVILIGKMHNIKDWSAGPWMEVGLIILAISKSLHFKYFNYRYELNKEKRRLLADTLVD